MPGLKPMPSEPQKRFTIPSMSVLGKPNPILPSLNESQQPDQTMNQPKLDRDKLMAAAADVRLNAYAPYSKFKVGAAVFTRTGRIYTGCNVENASYGLTICAERAAIFKAIADGESRLIALAVCLQGAASPCGACRQVIHEFGPAIPILTCDPNGKLIGEYTLDRLLPDAFGPGSLKT